MKPARLAASIVLSLALHGADLRQVATLRTAVHSTRCVRGQSRCDRQTGRNAGVALSSSTLAPTTCNSRDGEWIRRQVQFALSWG